MRSNVLLLSALGFFICDSVILGKSEMLLLSNFNSVDNRWNVEYGGTWNYVDNVYEGIERSSYAGDKNWSDYKFSFSARCLDPDNNGQIWASFRYTNEWNRYAIALRGGQLNDILLLRYAETDGSQPDVTIGKAYPLGFKFQPRQWYKFQVEIRGKLIKVWIGDVNVPQVTYLDADPIKAGSIALGGSWHVCQFDNVKVETLSQPESELQQNNEEQIALERAKNDLKQKKIERRASYKPRQIVDDCRNPRTVVPLNGTWLFMPEYELPNDVNVFDPSVSDMNWHTLNVPDFWNQIGWWITYGLRGQADSFIHQEMQRTADYTFDSSKTNSAWYRNWIRLPKQQSNRRVIIKFDASATISRVYFNGNLIGSHLGMFAPFEFDVTDSAKWDQDNLLAVYVANGIASKSSKAVKTVAVTMDITDEMLKSIPQGMYYASFETTGRQVTSRVGGIWQPVTLMMVPSVHITDIFFQPRLDGAKASVTVKNLSDRIFNGTVKIRVNDTLTWQNIALDSNSQGVFDIEVKAGNPKPWSPEYPNLYKLETSLYQNNALLDSVVNDIGFRTFEVRGTTFYLNGEPYWLKGANMPPSGLRPNDAKLADKFLKIMHDGNAFVTRIHGAPLTQLWCDAADKQGVALSIEGTWPWLMIRTSDIPDANILRIWHQEMLDMVNSLKNHPSIIMWTVANEQCFWQDPNAERRTKKWQIVSDMVKAIRKIDPTRPIVMDSHYVRDYNESCGFLGTPERLAFNFDDGDISDEHLYNGWYRPSPFSDEQHNGLYLPRNCTQPFISQEASTGYPNGDTGSPTRMYIERFVPQTWVGDYGFEHRNPAAFLTHNAIVTKEWVEDVRRTRRTAGWMMFSLLCWFQNAADIEHIKPYPAYYAFKTAMSDVLVSLDQRNRHYFAGDTIQGNIFVVNDDRDKRNFDHLRCKMSLLYDSKVISESETALPDCDYYQNQSSPAQIQVPANLPAERGDYELRLELYSGTQKVSQNSYIVMLASHEWAMPKINSNRPIVLLGRTESYKEYFNTLHLKTSGFNQAHRLGKNSIVIWTQMMSPTRNSWIGGILSDFVNEGGTLLLLETCSAERILDPNLVTSESNYFECEFVNMEQPQHPVFSSLDHMDLKWWNGNDTAPCVARAVYRVEYPKPVFIDLLGEYIPPHYDWKGPKLYPIFIVQQGKGRIIVSELRTSAWKSDPIAGRVLTNLLKFVLDCDPPAQAQISQQF